MPLVIEHPKLPVGVTRPPCTPACDPGIRHLATGHHDIVVGHRDGVALYTKGGDVIDGPTPEQREKAWFKVRMVGQANGTRVVSEVSGGDPGYGETSKMLAESALSLAFDDLPQRAGQITPAVAMGEALIDRLQRAGISFRTLESAA